MSDTDKIENPVIRPEMAERVAVRALCPVCQENSVPAKTGTENRPLQACPQCMIAKNAKNQQRFIETRLPKLLKNCGVPKRFKDALLTDFETGLVTDILKDAYFHGPRGTGKTHLLCALLRETLIAKEWDCLFTPAAELLLEIRSTFDPNSKDGTMELVKRYSDADHLFLDDLGAEKSTEWARETLHVILDRRYRNMKHTIVSSNLGLDALADKLKDDRITSRLAGMCVVTEMSGDDRRLQETI